MTSKQSKQAEEPQNTARNYRHALLALLSHKAETSTDCPRPEVLAAFAEERLSGKKRRRIMSHLADCAACRHQWQLVGSTRAEPAPVKVHTPSQGWGPLLKRIFVGSGLGLALTACLVLIYINIRPDELNKMLTRSYGELSPTDISRFNSFVLKGVEPAEKKTPSQAKSAYNAGLAEGRRRLLDASKKRTEKSLEDKGMSHLYYLGQWIVLLQCSCISHEPPVNAFWAEQLEISRKLKNKIKDGLTAENETSNRQIGSAVYRIEKAIQQISDTGGKVDGCDNITSAVEMLENAFN